jgi:energy-coupling factor transporter ATP-binding protein EcfA2
MTTAIAAPEPLLRTLAPALRQLERSLRAWLDAPEHRYPLSTITRATFEGLATDLHRQAEALDVDRPLLVIMLMGGTGVGKSTLLNALAGGSIAQASYTRPTTRDPVVYYHESVRPERLDPALRHCRLAPHDRLSLEHKIIVDTPDLDSNDLANRDKLKAILPVADVVLYVGSQEKYHDKLGWDLFLHERRRRAFAFVLNKWDRCLHNGAAGLRPDEDLLKDLRAEGFQDPLIFRTCAQHWIDENKREHVDGNGQNEANGSLDTNSGSSVRQLPEGEQFSDLVQWLEKGLTRLEIEAIKARGVSQLLQQLQNALTTACPPDLSEESARVSKSWEHLLKEEAESNAAILLNTLEPYQREIEHHFAVEGQRRFRGLMASYLSLFTRVKYVGTGLRDRIPFLPKSRNAVAAPATWDLATFTKACSDVAATRHLDARGKALSNRLLVEADAFGFPLNLLAEPVEAASKLDWRQRYSQTLIEIVHEVEQQWSRPTGGRRWLQGTLVLLADWLPPLALLAALAQLLWRFFDPMGKGYASPQLFDIFLPAIIVLVVLVILHLLIALLLPLRWPAIRGQFQRELERRLLTELETAYNPVPGDVTQALLVERKQVEKLLAETREVAEWLSQREQAASIGGLYGT